MSKKFITNNSSQTQKLGYDLAKDILKSEASKTSVVLCLRGELGAGKTTFLQGFAKGLGIIKEKILSPTFILMKKFKIPKDTTKTKPFNKERPFFIKYKYFYHFDCYRIKNEKDLEVLGFKKVISNPQNIVAIEWPEKVKRILPKNIVLVKFKHIGGNIRNLTINK